MHNCTAELPPAPMPRSAARAVRLLRHTIPLPARPLQLSNYQHQFSYTSTPTQLRHQNLSEPDDAVGYVLDLARSLSIYLLPHRLAEQSGVEACVG
jgi:hypothetical protein